MAQSGAMVVTQNSGSIVLSVGINGTTPKNAKMEKRIEKRR